MSRLYDGVKYYQDYNLLMKLCEATGQHPYSLKRSSMLLAKSLDIKWPLRKTVKGMKQ